jgi:hypothetical protein
MVKQHKHEDAVGKSKQEEIWSSVTGEMEKVEKYTKSKMASHKAQSIKDELAKSTKSNTRERWNEVKNKAKDKNWRKEVCSV